MMCSTDFSNIAELLMCARCPSLMQSTCLYYYHGNETSKCVIRFI